MPTTQNVEMVLYDYNPNPPPPTGKAAKKGAPVTPQEPQKYAAAYINFMDGTFSRERIAFRSYSTLMISD